MCWTLYDIIWSDLIMWSSHLTWAWDQKLILQCAHNYSTPTGKILSIFCPFLFNFFSSMQSIEPMVLIISNMVICMCFIRSNLLYKTKLSGLSWHELPQPKFYEALLEFHLRRHHHNLGQVMLESATWNLIFHSDISLANSSMAKYMCKLLWYLPISKPLFELINYIVDSKVWLLI